MKVTFASPTKNSTRYGETEKNAVANLFAFHGNEINNQTAIRTNFFDPAIKLTIIA